MLFRTLTVGLLALVLAVGIASSAWAEEILDQVNDPVESYSGVFLWEPEGYSFYQEFTPTLGVLSAVELRLRHGLGIPAEGIYKTVKIRERTWDGPILATATALITDPANTSGGAQILWRFDFEDILVTPGEVYLIEYVEPEFALSWVSSFSSSYAAGQSINHFGTPSHNVDHHFRTWGRFADAAAVLEDLLDTVLSELELPDSLAEPLANSLMTALAKLADENGANDIVAVNALNAFKQKVDAQAGKKITEEDAQALLDAADAALLLMD